MIGQTDLMDLLCPLTPAAQRFQRFHEANPHVYDVLVTLARQWVQRTGRHRVGMQTLIERARWELALQTDEAPKINNSYSAFYARLIMSRNPDLDGLFELRRAVADRGIGVAA